MKLSAATAGTAAAAGTLADSAGAMELEEGGRDFSPTTSVERKVIPSACWQCVARDAILCYVEDGKLVKIEGNPRSIRNRGVICSKGQAGISQLYDPDRLLHPLKRDGKRGEGKWKQISWDEALDLLINGGDIAGTKVKGLKTLRDEGTPEKFMFHYGRMKGSDSAILKNNFLLAYGTKTVAGHTTICEGAKWVAQELTWGKHYDVNDVEHTNMILNFGCNFFEAHTSHIQLAQRAINAQARGVRVVTFDVRLSNTAAKSDEWIPIKPGTDGAVALAMCNVIMQKDLYNADFIETWTNVTVQQLKDHLKQYTPEWAEGISGVSAQKIRALAIQYAKANPGTCVSYRGAVAHYNGVQNERAMKMLDAICGYIDVKGGTCRAVGAKFSSPKAKGHPKGLKIIDGFPGEVAYPTHHSDHQVLKMIKDGSAGRPEIYMIYCYNPAYVNGGIKEHVEILKDTSLIPFFVSVDIAMSESTHLADLVLPDVSYLERWSWDNMVSYAMIPEHYLRQPVVEPRGECRQFQDVAIDIAKRLGIDLGFESTVEFIKTSCEMSGVDFDYLKKHGVWYPEGSKPKYKSYAKKIQPAAYTGGDIVFDEPTGVYWNWKKSSAKSKEEAAKKGYTATKNAYKGYVGQKIGDAVYSGFKPDKLNKSGKFELYSEFLKKKGFDPLPSYMPIPEHQNLREDQLILTTYKVNVQSHSRTQNNKWLTEIYHENPMLIHPKTAAKRSIKDGDKAKVQSDWGFVEAVARVTEGVHPGVVCVSFHCGHWQYGEYASGKETGWHKCEPDCGRKWWKGVGVNPNWVIPAKPDPIGGQLQFMDTVVTVAKV
jgi:anaerobic selenocysteine-containing dehydrogenase